MLGVIVMQLLLKNTVAETGSLSNVFRGTNGSAVTDSLSHYCWHSHLSLGTRPPVDGKGDCVKITI